LPITQPNTDKCEHDMRVDNK